MKQKVLVVGAGGQLGRELQRTANGAVECLALTRDQLDIADAVAVDKRLADLRPQLVINAAAYTAVDRAGRNPKRPIAATPRVRARSPWPVRGGGETDPYLHRFCL
ncbi:MAG: sugar nucleotide-binding protein [Halioglobus sp.]